VHRHVPSMCVTSQGADERSHASRRSDETHNEPPHLSAMFERIGDGRQETGGRSDVCFLEVDLDYVAVALDESHTDVIPHGL
jgi:hypothetical protein